MSVVAKSIPKNRGKQTPELRIDSGLSKSVSQAQKLPSRSQKRAPGSSKMTFGDSKMSSGSPPESPSGTWGRPVLPPRRKIANRLRGSTISGTQQYNWGGSAPQLPIALLQLCNGTVPTTGLPCLPARRTPRGRRTRRGHAATCADPGGQLKHSYFEAKNNSSLFLKLS